MSLGIDTEPPATLEESLIESMIEVIETHAHGLSEAVRALERNVADHIVPGLLSAQRHKLLGSVIALGDPVGWLEDQVSSPTMDEALAMRQAYSTWRAERKTP